MCLKQKGAISTLSGKPLKSVDHVTYFGTNITFSQNDVNIHLVRNVTDRLSTTWKSDLLDEIKWDFFQAVTVSILSYGCTT